MTDDPLKLIIENLRARAERQTRHLSKGHPSRIDEPVDISYSELITLLDAVEALDEGLAKIEDDKSFVESQSTGVKYEFVTEAAQLALAARAKARSGIGEAK